MAIYFTNPSENSSKGKIVRSITSDAEGNIWFCTEEGYLNILDPQGHEMRNSTITDGANLHGLVMDNDTLWICAYDKGLYRYDVKSGTVTGHHDFPGIS